MMTSTHDPAEQSGERSETMTDEDIPAAEQAAWCRHQAFMPAEDVQSETVPGLKNLSAGFIFSGVIRPLVPDPPEYVTLPANDSKAEVALCEWNMLWEAAQFRRRFFDLDTLPEKMAQVAHIGDRNISFVPRTETRYHEYTPLFHLLPQYTLNRFGLPILRSGTWPYMMDGIQIEQFLPSDFQQRLARAWAHMVWPHLDSGSTITAFSKDDPIRLLAHNLDYWLPAVTATIQNRLRELPEVDKGRERGPVPLEDGTFLHGAVTANPRKGGHVWMGEEDAREALRESVESADATGRLRGIIDAVRSHRTEDDFSSQWSNARIDFERKLHRTRNKVSVRFVELPDCLSVQGPESAVVGQIVTNDFMTLLDKKNRQIVVLLNSGVTRNTEIAKILGYANHSPVSKRLTQIRRAAQKFFDDLD